MKLSTFILLCLITLCIHSTIERFDDIGSQLLINPDFVVGLQGWQASKPKATAAINSGGVSLHSDDERVSIQLSQKLDTALIGKLVDLKGRVKTIEIHAGGKNWEKGRVLLVQYVGGKAMYSTPHVAVALDGTHEWADYSTVFSILPKATEVRVILQLSHYAGELRVKDLSLFQVMVNPLYRLAGWLVFGLWGCFLMYVFIPVMFDSGGKRKWTALLALVVIAIIFGTTMPATLKHEAKDEIISKAKIYTREIIDYGGNDLEKIAAEVKAQPWLRVDITKIAHFLLFALLGGSCM